jgi:hypothetical protein
MNFSFKFKKGPQSPVGRETVPLKILKPLLKDTCYFSGSATIRATQWIIIASYNQRQPFFLS